MALTYRPDEAEIIRSVINGIKGEEPEVQDDEFFCLDYTSYCSGSCLYCERSRNNWDLKRERMTPDEILEKLKTAYDKGIRRFFLYGGADLFFVREKYVDIIQRFKSDCPDSELYLAAGEKVFEDYAAYKEAGLDGYVLFHRSADEDHFAKLHTIESYPDFRKRMLPILREAGMKIGTGVTVGWPYPAGEILAKDIEFLMDLEPDLVVVEPFRPEKGTEFEGFEKGDKKQQKKVVKLLRKIFPEMTILTHL